MEYKAKRMDTVQLDDKIDHIDILSQKILQTEYATYGYTFTK